MSERAGVSSGTRIDKAVNLSAAKAEAEEPSGATDSIEATESAELAEPRESEEPSEAVESVETTEVETTE